MSPVKKQDKHRNKKVAKQNQGRSYASYSLMALLKKCIGMSPILTFHGVKPKSFLRATNTTSVSRVFLRKDSLFDSSYSIEGAEDHSTGSLEKAKSTRK